MATKEKKGQKFGRKRDRSKSHKNYNLGRRDMVNKLRKLRKHVAANPNDKKNASALATIAKGGLEGASGPAGVFPYIGISKDNRKMEGLNDLEFDFRKHHLVKDSKGKKVMVLDELVATRPIYECVSDCGVVQDRAMVVEELDKCYRRSHGSMSIVERVGDKVKLMYHKKATPPPGFENRVLRAYAG